MSLDKADESVLGLAARVVVGKETCTIVGTGATEAAVNQRIAALKQLIENTEQDFEVEKLSERAARLSGGVAIIQVRRLLLRRPARGTAQRKAAWRSAAMWSAGWRQPVLSHVARASATAAWLTAAWSRRPRLLAAQRLGLAFGFGGLHLVLGACIWCWGLAFGAGDLHSALKACWCRSPVFAVFALACHA
eukprot:158541-Chlamydomonas_euryale.AAC.4